MGKADNRVNIKMALGAKKGEIEEQTLSPGAKILFNSCSEKDLENYLKDKPKYKKTSIQPKPKGRVVVT